MLLHHDKHHAGYVTKLNEALEDYPKLQARTASWLLANSDGLPEEIRSEVRNNAGGHVNHSLFWRGMSPDGGGEPAGPLADAIESDFGDLDQFKQEFVDSGAGVFGSGWVWLAREKDSGTLKIYTTSGHDNPLMQGSFPILVNDVWEHAYYLEYENRRKDYLEAWWSVVDWKEVSRRFQKSAPPAVKAWEDEGGATKDTSVPGELSEILDKLLD